jgi:hypothetical protein
MLRQYYEGGIAHLEKYPPQQSLDNHFNLGIIPANIMNTLIHENVYLIRSDKLVFLKQSRKCYRFSFLFCLKRVLYVLC